MNRLRAAVLAPTLILGLASVPGAADAANRFDGAWSVVATAESGTCTGPYRYPIVIRDGLVDDAGDNGVDASGRAAEDGRITGTIRRGLANVTVSGRLNGQAGRGRWTLSGLGACSGRWTARRAG
jgi:hypothetical protein